MTRPSVTAPGFEKLKSSRGSSSGAKSSSEPVLVISKKRFHEEAESEDETLQESTAVMNFFGTKAMSIISSAPKSFYSPGKPLNHGMWLQPRYPFCAVGEDIEHILVYIFIGRKRNGMHIGERFLLMLKAVFMSHLMLIFVFVLIVQSRIHVTLDVDVCALLLFNQKHDCQIELYVDRVKHIFF